MTVKHHPSDATMAALAGGQLDGGSSVVVASHLATCPSCRRWLRALEDVGGMLLSDLPPTPMSPGALTRTMARLAGPFEQGKHVRTAPVVEDLPWLPEALRPYELGPWRWIGPGVYQRKVSVPTNGDARVFLLKAAPGTKLPEHTHTGVERTQVLTGAFTHDGGRFAAGDFDDAEGDTEHRPRVDMDEGCICLVAMTGGITLTGRIGRLIQPFVRL